MKPALEHVDVLIVGAGLSGIGAAAVLRREQPERSFAILEARASLGGTWDLFRYPGVRSDSDLHTLSYAFRPWQGESGVASADAILAYLRETVVEHDLERAIRFQHRVRAAWWSRAEARWVVDVERTENGGEASRAVLTCRWLFCASGYYRYDRGFAPRFEGAEHFAGRIVHPQHWPDDLVTDGKRIVVIGSGATAVTLVPALAARAAHVTMVQRTPTFVLPVTETDLVARLARAVLPKRWAYALTREKNAMRQLWFWRFCRRHPRAARRFIRFLNQLYLPRGYPVNAHFRPPYEPWDQRLCVAPGGDLFRAIAGGRASVVTEAVAGFTEHGVRLQSGTVLDADVVVTATGIELQAMGGIELTVDGVRVDVGQCVAHRGMMLSGVPNFAFAVGYANASWTLKVSLVWERFCRLLAHMDATGDAICTPELNDTAMPTFPLLELQAGYVERARGIPRRGERAPWSMAVDYFEDRKRMRDDAIDEPTLRFSKAPKPSVTPAFGPRAPA